MRTEQDRACQEAFEGWADDHGHDFCLDQLFFRVDGHPRNPYTDEETQNVYAVWMAGWDAASARATGQATTEGRVR